MNRTVAMKLIFSLKLINPLTVPDRSDVHSHESMTICHHCVHSFHTLSQENRDLPVLPQVQFHLKIKKNKTFISQIALKFYMFLALLLLNLHAPTPLPIMITDLVSSCSNLSPIILFIVLTHCNHFEFNKENVWQKQRTTIWNIAAVRQDAKQL